MCKQVMKVRQVARYTKVKYWIVLMFTAVTCLLVDAASADNSCSINIVSGVNFGTYDPLGSSDDTAIGKVQVHCDQNISISYSIAMNIGLGSSSFNPRKMTRTGGGGTLNYNLYSDAGYKSIWGDGSGGTGVVVGKNAPCHSGNQCIKTVYGMIPASQTTVIPGTYRDTITVTLTY